MDMSGIVYTIACLKIRFYTIDSKPISYVNNVSHMLLFFKEFLYFFHRHCFIISTVPICTERAGQSLLIKLAKIVINIEAVTFSLLAHFLNKSSISSLFVISR